MVSIGAFILIISVVTSALAGGIVLSALHKARVAARILFSVALTVGWGSVYLVAAVLAAMTWGLNGAFWNTALNIIGILVWLVGMLSIWGVMKKRAVWATCVIVSALLIAAMAGHVRYQKYLDTIPTVDENTDLLPAYAPWGAETKAAELNGPATLQLSEGLPRMDGATALFPVYSSFARAVYPKETLETWDYQWMEAPLVCNKTNGAYDALIYGDADIIFVSGPSEAQEQLAKSEGVELVYTPIGKEGFVFFVNADNPLENITVEQIKEIYSGKSTKWKELGVEGLGSIRAFQRPENSGSQTRLQRLMGDTPLMEAPRQDVATGMGEIIRQTADYKNHKNAIGYSFRFYATEMAANDQIKLLKIEGVAPTEANIADNSYPLTGTFYAVTRKDAGENVQKLLEWIQGPQGQELIARVGYTPLHP